MVGEPGWVAERPTPRASLAVQANVSVAGGALVIGYLRSYDPRMACANLTYGVISGAIDGAVHGAPLLGHTVLDGHWASQSSLDEAHIVYLTNLASAQTDSHEATLTITVRLEVLPCAVCEAPGNRQCGAGLNGTKFKLTQVSSC